MKRLIWGALTVIMLLETNSLNINAYQFNVNDIQDNANDTQKVKEIIKPAYLTMYDFATERDLYYSHLTSKLVQDSDPEKWGIFSDIKATFGKPVAEIFEAKKIVGLMKETFPLEGQNAAKQINDLVSECATILDIKSPKINVRVRGYYEPLAYIIEDVNDEYSLVLTSALLELYQTTPNELKFIIGHELGHVKANHIQSYQASSVVLKLLSGAALLGKNSPIGTALQVLPPLAFGFFLTWSREAEITADRAGLLCCQDINVATQALMRLSHQIPKDNKLLNSEFPDFDPQKIVESFEEWENKPFVEFLLRLQEGTSTHPFIPQRIAAIMMWEKSDNYQQILERQAIPTEKHLLSFRKIAIRKLGTNEDKENPYIKIYYNRQEIFQSEKLSNTSNPYWIELNTDIEYFEGCPLFIEVWDRGRIGGWAKKVGDLWKPLNSVESVGDWTEKRIGIGMFYPQTGQTEYSFELKQTEDRPSILSRPIATVIVEVK